VCGLLARENRRRLGLACSNKHVDQEVMAASLQREKDGLDAMIGHEVALRDGEKENVRLNGIKKRLEEEHQALKVSLTDCEAQIQVLTCSKGQLEQKVRGFEEAELQDPNGAGGAARRGGRAGSLPLIRALQLLDGFLLRYLRRPGYLLNEERFFLQPACL